jgi:hypothetical protein
MDPVIAIVTGGKCGNGKGTVTGLVEKIYSNNGMQRCCRKQREYVK